MLCHIQKHTKNPREKKLYQATNLMVLWTLVAFVPNTCAYVYDTCMGVRRGCWCRMLEMDSIVQQRIAQNREGNTIFKKSDNNREAVNRSTSYSAVYNRNWNFSQTERGCIKWHDERFSFDSPSNCKPENGQTLHNSFLHNPREIHLSSETIKTKIKEAFIKTNTPLWLNKFFFGVAKAGSG